MNSTNLTGIRTPLPKSEPLSTTLLYVRNFVIDAKLMDDDILTGKSGFLFTCSKLTYVTK